MARNEKHLERREELGVRRDREGRVVSVKVDRHVLDPESPLAVQIPERLQELAGGNPLDALAEEDYVDHEVEARKAEAKRKDS